MKLKDAPWKESYDKPRQCCKNRDITFLTKVHVVKAMVFPKVMYICECVCVCVCVKVAQLCPTLCDPMDCTVHGILKARILEWVAFPFSRGSSQPGIKPRSSALQVDSSPAEPQGKPTDVRVGP